MLLWVVVVMVSGLANAETALLKDPPVADNDDDRSPRDDRVVTREMTRGEMRIG